MHRIKLFATLCVLLLTLNSCFVTGGLLEQRFVRSTRRAEGIPDENNPDTIEGNSDPINERDWMSDIIYYLLGLTTGVFLEIITYNLDVLKARIVESQGKIGEGIGNADPTTQTQLRALNDTLNAVLALHVQPLLSDLMRVLPSLTRAEQSAAKAGVMPLDANDIIESLLGLTLAEFIEKIYCGLSKSDGNLYNHIVVLEDTAGRVPDPVLKNILVWLVNKLTESRRGIQPHLTNLRRILGEEQPQSRCDNYTY